MSDTNLVNVITADHRAVEAAFAELESTSMSPEHRRDLVDHVIAELARHSDAEEQYMYPTVRVFVPGGDAIINREIKEHAAIERVMKDLDGMEVTDARFEPKLRELMDGVRHHVKEEEGILLPRMTRVCEPAMLRDLGEKVLRAKETAPSRPYPSAQGTPPLSSA